MQENLVVLFSNHTPRLRFEKRTARSVYCFAVNGEPFTYLGEPFEGQSRDAAIRLRTYIEKKVCIAAGRTDQKPDKFLVSLVCVVIDVKAPGFVYGLAGFERECSAYNICSAVTCSIFAWYVAFKKLYVLTRDGTAVVVVTYETTRLQTVYQLINTAIAPIEIDIGIGTVLLLLDVVPVSVKPDATDRTLLGQKFRNLIAHKIKV